MALHNITRGWGRSLGLLAILLAWMATGKASATYSVNHHTTAEVSTSTNTLTVTIPSTTGNLIAVPAVINFSATVKIASITDNAPGGSNTYTNSNLYTADTNDGSGVDLWYALNAKTGVTSITITLTGAGASWGVDVVEIGGGATNTMDVSNTAAGTYSGTSITGP